MALIVLAMGACKKEERNERFATLRVVNVWAAQDAVKLNSPVNYASSLFTYVKAEEPATITVSSIDDKQVFFSGAYTLQPKIYSMYLSGTALKPDTMLREETDFPYIQTDRTPKPADSVTYIRFVNLSAGATVLKINLLGAQNAPAAPARTNIPSIQPPAALSYQQISPWSKYPAWASARTTYSFEVRDAATNEVLIENYSLPVTPSSGYFKNIALVIKGVPGGTGKNAFGIIQSNYF